MRSFLVLIITACVLALVFGVYWTMQDSTPANRPVLPASAAGTRTSTRSADPTLPTSGPTRVPQAGQPYWERYDAATGELTSRLRARQYRFLPDGRAEVQGPEVEFFLRNGQVVRIVGTRGYITMEQGMGRGDDAVSASFNQTPRSGDLKDVRIDILPRAGATEPSIVMSMNNASFDTETFRIATESYTDDKGREVPADQVPVTVRGKFEFDGSGLKIQYNELDRRLDFLQIAHGRRLLIKNPSRVMKLRPEAAMRPSAALPSPSAPLEGWAFAAADSRAVGAAIRANRARPATRPARDLPEERPIYRALFRKNVEAFQDSARLAFAQELQIDFLDDGDGDLGDITGSGAPDAARAPRRTTSPATRPAVARGPSTRKAAPASQPNEQPIEIRWSGPLTITPINIDRSRIAPGESIVRLIGTADSPVEVTHTTETGSSTIQCGSLTHWTIDSAVQLDAAPRPHIEITDTRDTRIVARSLYFSQADGTARLSGKGEARLPLDETTGDAKKKDMLDVSWGDRCVLYLHGDSLESMVLTRADLQGGVRVAPPDMTLTSESLQLLFTSDQPQAGAPGTRPAKPSQTIQQMDASGRVRCVMQDPEQPQNRRTFDCENLKMLTERAPDGKRFVRNVLAIRNVKAVDPERTLEAGYVSATLRPPAPRPEPNSTQASMPSQPVLPPTTRRATDAVASAQLEGLVAHEDVRITTFDGKRARADQLIIEMKDGQPVVTLHGQPATVVQEQSTLTGPVIRMDATSQELTVTKEGRLDSRVGKGAGSENRPLHVAWQRTMRADGKQDVIEAVGGVLVEAVDEEGAVNTIKGDRIRLATTRPATRPATPPQPAPGAVAAATRPSRDIDLMADREVRAFSIHDGAEVTSDLYDKAANLLRRFHIKSDSIHYSRDDQKLRIPQAGQLLFVDNREPSADAAAREAADDPLGMRGQTAFAWTRSLTYDEATRQIEMLGDVQIARLDAGKQDVTPLRLFADRLVAQLEAPPATQPAESPQAATRPAALGMSGMSSRMQMKSVTASGNIRVEDRGATLTADTMEYDPVGHRLTLRGRERAPVEMQRTAEKGIETITADFLVLNTRTLEIVDSRNMTIRSLR